MGDMRVLEDLNVGRYQKPKTFGPAVQHMDGASLSFRASKEYFFFSLSSALFVPTSVLKFAEGFFR